MTCKIIKGPDAPKIAPICWLPWSFRCTRYCWYYLHRLYIIVVLFGLFSGLSLQFNLVKRVEFGAELRFTAGQQHRNNQSKNIYLTCAKTICFVCNNCKFGNDQLWLRLKSFNWKRSSAWNDCLAVLTSLRASLKSKSSITEQVMVCCFCFWEQQYKVAIMKCNSQVADITTLFLCSVIWVLVSLLAQ